MTVDWIEWAYLEFIGGGKCLTIAMIWDKPGRVYTEEDLPQIAERINRELKAEQLRSFHPGEERKIPSGPMKVTVEQVREALGGFPELFMEVENGNQEDWFYKDKLTGMGSLSGRQETGSNRTATSSVCPRWSRGIE